MATTAFRTLVKKTKHVAKAQVSVTTQDETRKEMSADAEPVAESAAETSEQIEHGDGPTNSLSMTTRSLVHLFRGEEPEDADCTDKVAEPTIDEIRVDVFGLQNTDTDRPEFEASVARADEAETSLNRLRGQRLVQATRRTPSETKPEALRSLWSELNMMLSRCTQMKVICEAQCEGAVACMCVGA